MSSELKYTLISLASVVVTAAFRETRVLVLPAIFVLVTVLLFWLAKPKAEE